MKHPVLSQQFPLPAHQVKDSSFQLKGAFMTFFPLLILSVFCLHRLLTGKKGKKNIERPDCVCLLPLSNNVSVSTRYIWLFPSICNGNNLPSTNVGGAGNSIKVAHCQSFRGGDVNKWMRFQFSTPVWSVGSHWIHSVCLLPSFVQCNVCSFPLHICTMIP